MSLIDALVGALAGIPVLREARCRGRHHLFDPRAEGEPAEVAEDRHRQALAICDACPVLLDCGQWAETLSPRQRPGGVIGGRLITQPNPKERTTV